MATSPAHYVQEDVHDFGWIGRSELRRGERPILRHARCDRGRADAAAAKLVDRPLDECASPTWTFACSCDPRTCRRRSATWKAHGRPSSTSASGMGAIPTPRSPWWILRHGGLGSGGMDTPTFITGGTRMLLNRWPLDHVHLAEEVTIHEMATSIGMAWSDRTSSRRPGSTKGSTRIQPAGSSIALYGPETLRGHRARASHRSPRRSAEDQLLFARSIDCDSPRGRNSPGSYGFYSYDRTDLTLETLEHLLGEPTMARIMRTYSERWRFRHPSSDDFYAVASEVAGRDLMWFFKPAAETADYVDYEVSSADSRQREGDAGRLGETTTLTEAKEPGDRTPHDSVIVVAPSRRHRAAPGRSELTFEGGRKGAAGLGWRRSMEAAVDPHHERSPRARRDRPRSSHLAST